MQNIHTKLTKLDMLAEDITHKQGDTKLEMLPEDITHMYVQKGEFSLRDVSQLSMVSKFFERTMDRCKPAFFGACIDQNKEPISLNNLLKWAEKYGGAVTSFTPKRILQILPIGSWTPISEQADFCCILHRLKRLSDLDLSEIPLGDSLIKNMRSTESLRVLNLRGTCISKGALESLLPALIAVEELNIRTIAIDDESLKALPEKDKLKKLAVESDLITPNICPLLEAFSRLETLEMKSKGIDLKTYKKILSCSSITTLYCPRDMQISELQAHMPEKKVKPLDSIIKPLYDSRYRVGVKITFNYRFKPNVEYSASPRK